MMKDMIDKRNERERIARSIIKYWNVNYIPRTQADPEIQKQTAEAENAQNKTAEKSTQEDYNKATNSYSGKYGQEKDLDEVTKDQIDKILAINSDAQAYKQAGNSVTVTVIEAIGRRIRGVWCFVERRHRY
mgnify:CR=1 FL=1